MQSAIDIFYVAFILTYLKHFLFQVHENVP